MRSQPSKADAENRAERFKEKYVRRLKDLKENPWYQSTYNIAKLHLSDCM